MPGKSIDDMVSILFPDGNKEKNPWHGVSRILAKVWVNVASGTEGYSFDGAVIGAPMMADIMNGVKALGMEDVVDEEAVNNFFLRNGQVATTSAQSIAYSSLYTLNLFLNGGYEFDGLSRPADTSDAKEMLKFEKSYMLRSAGVFSYLFSMVYPGPSQEEPGMFARMRKSYSPKSDFEPSDAYKQDVQRIKESFERSRLLRAS